MNFIKIRKISYYLSFGFITLTVEIILSICTLIYMYVIFTSNLVFLRGLSFSINLIVLLTLNCIINGKVIEETIKLLNDLDNLNINVKIDEFYHDLILLKTSIENLKCGFSIGGFASWNKLTLLQVRN